MSDQEQSPNILAINTSLNKTSYLLILLLSLIISSYTLYHSLNYYHLSTITHFRVDTTTNTLSYNLTLTLTLPTNNFLGVRHVSIRTSPCIYTVHRHVRSSYIEKSPLFYGPEHVTWSGWNATVCDFSSKKYYHKEPMGEFFIHIKVYLYSRFQLSAVTVPVRSTAECIVELPLSTSPNGVYGGSFGPTKCG